jgi:hypothetical protein
VSPISDDLRRDAWLAESRQPLVCLEITHPNLPVPIRVVNNTQDVVLVDTNAENLFVAFAFELSLPDQLESAPPSARLRIDNVSGVIAASVRSITTPAAVRILVVRVVGASDDPPVHVEVELEFPSFKLSGITIDALSVSGSLTVENLVREPYPAHSFSPAEFPGLL